MKGFLRGALMLFLIAAPVSLATSATGTRVSLKMNDACAQVDEGCKCGAGTGYCGVVPHSQCW